MRSCMPTWCFNYHPFMQESNGSLLPELCKATELLEIGDTIASTEYESDDCDVDDDIDPVLKEKIDR